jgi:PAS domain S-box-containing protein
MPKQRRNASIHVRNETERALRRSAQWSTGQKEAFQAAMDGAALETSLGILIRTAIEQAKDSRRCAFFAVRSNGIELQHVVGMGEAYHRRVDGFKISPNSLACGLAAWSGQPVITPDVEEEPRWKPWLWLAREFGYRGCWSFPVETSVGKIVGTFAMYFNAPRQPTARDRELIASLTHSASIIISHHEEAQARKEHQERQRLLVDELNQREARLQEALAAGSVLAFEWDVSTDLVRRSNNAAQILGLEPRQTLEGKSFFARVHPEDLARMKALWSTLNRDNPTCSITYRFLLLDGREVWLKETSKAEFDAAGRLVRLNGLALDVTERIRAEEHQKILMAELNHRVKNVLARVIAVGESTRQGSIDEFVRSHEGRIKSMSAAHALLSDIVWHGADLMALVRGQLAPYAMDANMTITGTDIMLSPSAAQAVAMVLHELVTNAVKHGALSIRGGRVSVSWERRLNGNPATNLILIWHEVGGPPAAREIQSGYGIELIRELIPHELGGNVDLMFASNGASCRIEIPLEQVGSDHPPC